MKYEELHSLLQNHLFKYEKYVQYAIDDDLIRNQLIHNITHKNHINIYYNSYHLIDEASKLQPELFYMYWDDLLPLLHHENSYHRSIAHWILTNLIPIDEQHKLDLIKDKYFHMIKDDKFLTGFMALKDIMIMSPYRPDLQEEIIRYLIMDAMYDGYSEKQYIKFQIEILHYLKPLVASGSYPATVTSYIKKQRTSTYPKLQKLANSIQL